MKSVTFDFADLPLEKQKRLPNLLEWLDPRWRIAMAKWIEEEVKLDEKREAERSHAKAASDMSKVADHDDSY